MHLYKLRAGLKRLFVVIMLQVVGRSLVASSRVEPGIRRELSELPKGYQIQMVVIPHGPGFVVECNGDGTLDLAKTVKPRVDLRIAFKHVSHAFLVLSFQEATAQAFANDRMVADGDISHAIRLVRCLNRMETLILPRWIAARAVKRLPEIPFAEKMVKAIRIYVQVMKNLVLFR
jgi:hypothetical protein